MIEIYGRAFRRQEQHRPWWWTASVVLGILIGLSWATFIAYMVGNFVIWCVRQQAPAHQLAAVRLVGLMGGVIALTATVSAWRQRLFLDAPIRDLASTPGSSWQVFRIAVRLKWFHIVSVQVLLTTIVLMPWFIDIYRQAAATFAWASADDPGWVLPAKLLNYLVIPLAFLTSALAVLTLHAIFSATAIALGFIFASLGTGGVAPRWPTVEKSLGHILNALLIGGLVAVVTTVAYWSSTDFPEPQPVWWSVGHWCHTVLDGQHPLTEWVRAFPGVALADLLYNLRTDQGSVQYPWFSMLAWGAVAVGIAAIFFRTGYSLSARSGYDREASSARPADADQTPSRSFDPDTVNGPLEQLFVGWLGRMGRAVLRMVSADVRSGAMDRLILRTLMASLICLAFGHLAMWLVPEALNAFLMAYGLGPLSSSSAENTRATVAVILLIVLSVHCLVSWAGPKIWQTGAKAHARDEQPDTASGSWGALFKKRKTATRGDRRYPLIEIYAVGFSDAVLLPTLYAGFWLFISGAAVGSTALLLGLRPLQVGWAVALGVPILWQISFLSYISGISNYWMHYSRSLLTQLFSSLWMGVLIAAGLIGIVILIVVICKFAFDADYPAWIPWLGSLNVLVMADVAFYMTVRWLYVRRRFDAEFRNPAAWG